MITHSSTPDVTDAAWHALASRLDSIRLFKRESQIERVLRLLDFSKTTPKTLLLTGTPASANHRFLDGFSGLFHGQPLPLAVAICHPERRSVPYRLATNLLAKFLASHAPAQLHACAGRTLEAYPWLAWFFHTLPTREAPPVPPAHPRELRPGLEALLSGIVRLAPHLAIVHNLCHADEESLHLLHALQLERGHGLRILANADPDADGQLPASLHPFASNGADIFAMPEIPALDYPELLGEIAPELAKPDIARRLYNLTHGQPLDVERTLRTWVLQEELQFDGQTWQYASRGDAGTTGDAIPASVLYERLGQAALVGTTTVSFLALLWNVSLDDARTIVAYGRRLCHISPLLPSDPHLVAWRDLDQVTYLTHQLSPAQRRNSHRHIAELLEQSTTHRLQVPGELPVAYHLQEAGLRETARAYLNAAKRTAHSLMLEQMATGAEVHGGSAVRWHVAPPQDMTNADLDLIVDAVIAIRLAGIQIRGRAAQLETGLPHMEQAFAALQRVLARRPSVIISFDGQTIAFDGVRIDRPDIIYAERDYQEWMQRGSLYAIGISRGIDAGELKRFLNALVTHDPGDDQITLLSKLAVLQLSHVCVHTGLFSHLLSQPEAAETALAAKMSHDDILTFLLTGVAPWEQYGIMALSASAAEDIDSQPRAAGRKSGLMTPKQWAALPAKLERAPAHMRRLLLANVTQLFRPDLDTQCSELPEGYDALIREQLAQEADGDILSDLVTFTRRRMEYGLAHQQWEVVIGYLRVILVRYARETHQQLRKSLTKLIETIASGGAFSPAFANLDDTPEMLEQLRELVAMLGVAAIRPMLNRLSLSESSRERLALVHQLSILCADYQTLLIQELKERHQWYYHRNVLAILASVGDDTALPAVSEKIMHPEPRVRAEAVATAAAIAKDRAVSYLMRGLADPDALVRTRSAAIAWLCPQRRVCQSLMSLLRSKGISRGEPEAVQIAACASLGHFKEIEARNTLIAIFTGKLVSPFRMKTEMVRLAALQGLVHHLDDPAVQEIIQRALRHRSTTLKQAARQLWDDHTMTQRAPVAL